MLEPVMKKEIKKVNLISCYTTQFLNAKRYTRKHVFVFIIEEIIDDDIWLKKCIRAIDKT